MKLEEFYKMTWRNYERACIGYFKRNRLFLGAITGTDPRKIYSIPGDFDDIPVNKGTKANIEELQKHGLFDLLKDINEKNSKRSSNES